MMRMKTKETALPTHGRAAGGVEPAAREWELRPGGMLVQKRNPDSDRISIPPPTIRVRVKYGSIYHEIHINSPATFGELKKLLIGPTGLHHQDQKLLYKDKERDSKAFLDTAGVKDKSKMVLIEDPISQEKRLLEMRKNAKMEKASKSICEISLEIDRLAGRVERVKKYVETLDMLKIKNSMPSSNGVEMEMQTQHSHTNLQKLAPIQEQQSKHSDSDGVVVTTNWEMFDSFPALQPVPSTSTSKANNSVQPKFPWEFFD